MRHTTSPPNVSKKDSKLARTGNTGSDRKLIICNHLALSVLSDYWFVISPASGAAQKCGADLRGRSRGQLVPRHRGFDSLNSADLAVGLG